jgi:hypothetical protein
MPTGRRKATLTISRTRASFGHNAVALSRSLSAAQTLRAKIVLACERESSSPATPLCRRTWSGSRSSRPNGESVIRGSARPGTEHGST